MGACGVRKNNFYIVNGINIISSGFAITGVVKKGQSWVGKEYLAKDHLNLNLWNICNYSRDSAAQ